MARSRGKWLGFTLIIIGGIFLLDSTGTFDFGDLVATYWPLLLVFWGVTMIARPGLRRRRDRDAPPRPAGETGPVGTAAGESLASSNVFGDVDLRVTSPYFRGGTVTTVFGDISVDCRQGGLADGEHSLTVSGVFGDSRIIVPPDVPLSVTAHTLAGDVSVLDQKRDGISPSLSYITPGYETAPKRLRITVSQVFGDVDVRR